MKALQHRWLSAAWWLAVAPLGCGGTHRAEQTPEVEIRHETDRAESSENEASNGQPLGWVRLTPALEISRSEATVGEYRRCVTAGACSADKLHGLEWPGRFEFEPRADCTYPSGRDDSPVNCVSYEDAQRFCAHHGGRLPTSDEWLVAASNGGTTRWPWGDEPEPNCARAVLGLGGNWCGGKPTAVCSRPAGNNRSGVCDLVGSVYEWTLRPTTAGQRWLMVGECFNNFAASRSLEEMQLEIESPIYRTVALGIRCVRER